MKRIWLVGGSSGIGLELAKIWLKQGYRVIVSSRHATDSDVLNFLLAIYPDTLSCIDMDASDTESVRKAVSDVWEQHGGIDWWFYNAGAYEVMPLDHWNAEQFRKIADVNYQGAVNVMCELAPYFKAQGHGRWIWNISLSSYFGLPQGGAYSAPKAALTNLAESIQPELETIGVKLQIINHGFVKTRLTAKNSFDMPQLMDPEDAAMQIADALEKPYRFEIRFPFGLSLFLRLLRFLPYRLSLYLTQKMLP